MIARVVLPWPASVLNPNIRAHWAPLAAARKRARRDAYLLTHAAGVSAPADGAVRVALTFYPPSRRRRDADNLVACMKAALDGIADALGCDDSRFRLAAPVIAEPVKGGAVHVTLTPEGDA